MITMDSPSPQKKPPVPPTYLLPPTSFQNQSGEPQQYLRCASCASDICLASQVISKGFTGRHGRAYLVSGSTSAANPNYRSPSTPTSNSLPNTVVQKAVSRQLVTGAHTVSDITCRFCDTVLGWKYISAEEESQRYKIGNFILETKRICTSFSWGPMGPPSNCDASNNRQETDEIEFDSQDEDECEDLFSGIWNPALAKKRRSLRKFNS